MSISSPVILSRAGLYCTRIDFKNQFSRGPESRISSTLAPKAHFIALKKRKQKWNGICETGFSL